MTERKTDIRGDFIAYMGQALEMQGLSPISGRILGLLIFDGEARSFSDLAIELGVSRGSISANARHLVARGAIEKVNHPGDRQDYFRMADPHYEAILTGMSEGLKTTARDVRGYADALPPGAGPRHRLTGMAQLYEAMAEGIGQAARQFGSGDQPPT